MIQATGLVQNSKEKQVSHCNRKKSNFSINSTHSKFLTKREHTRENLEKHSSHQSINSSSLYFQIIQNSWLKINFFKILLEPCWSNPWYTISMSILYITTLWESHSCIQQIICWKCLIFTQKKIVKLVNLGILEKWSRGGDVGGEAKPR